MFCPAIQYALFFSYSRSCAAVDGIEILPDFGVKIRHKQDGNLFNTRRLKNKSTQIASIGELLYADDVACVDHNATNPQTVTTSLNEAFLSWRLTISKPKTEVLPAS